MIDTFAKKQKIVNRWIDTIGIDPLIHRRLCPAMHVSNHLHPARKNMTGLGYRLIFVA